MDSMHACMHLACVYSCEQKNHTSRRLSVCLSACLLGIRNDCPDYVCPSSPSSKKPTFTWEVFIESLDAGVEELGYAWLRELHSNVFV